MNGLPEKLYSRLLGVLLTGLVTALLLSGRWASGDAPETLKNGARRPPAQRVVTLSPHLTELVFAAGAGSRLVGVVAFSDHPPEARALPRVGDAFRLDLEALAALKPDLILGWPSGNSPALLARLRRLGYRVVALEPRRLTDLGEQIEAIGRLAGTESKARPAAQAFRRGLTAVRIRYAQARPGRVFYQIAREPLITVNGAHFIGQAIELCGGVNVYAHLPELTPIVGVEAVLSAAPDVIVAENFTPGPVSDSAVSPLAMWRTWPQFPPVAKGRLYTVDPDLLSVPGPRVLAGVRQLCGLLNRPSPGPDGS